ncbi:PLC-like phosphodiesterase [Xylaria intraflava]|nr:PLC-like phosphodiesterase [Xylaria intraflava]
MPPQTTVAAWAGHRDTGPSPQIIGHRGYNAAYPENTMAAFRGAIEAGADALETDLHLSKDGVVVLSHDATLKRCFGHPRKVAECTWDELSKLHTLRDPKQPMARLVDLLEYLAQPEQERKWVLLDIKIHDNVTELLSRIAQTIESVHTTGRPWKERIILGTWTAEWVAGCLKHLPDFEITLIAASPSYATALLQVPNLNFNLNNYSFATASGARFLREAKQRRRIVFSWSNNKTEWMARCIHDGFDAVITDDPRQFLELRNRSSAEEIEKIAARWSLREIVLWVLINCFVWGFWTIFGIRKGSPRVQAKRILGV